MKPTAIGYYSTVITVLQLWIIFVSIQVSDEEFFRGVLLKGVNEGWIGGELGGGGKN